MTEEVLLGTAFVTDKGTWAAGTAYEENDIVHTDSGVYMSIVDDNTSDVSDTTKWRTWVDLDAVNTATSNANAATKEAEEAEVIRKSNEEARQANETSRQGNETTRQSNETTRVSAEASRVEAESSRVTAEASRIAAEEARAEAEASRVEAESSRVTAEASRVAAEEARETKTSDAIGEIKAMMDAFANTNPFCGFARVSGDNDPAPASDYVYGSRSLVREIGSHIKLGTVKRVDGEAVLQHSCAPGRITLASNGDAMAVDGTEGDLLVYTDIPLYLLKANETVNGNEMSCMGVGVIPCYWQNHMAKLISPFAFSPFCTVLAKLDGDERSQAHCIINDSVAGTYTAPNGLLKEVFKANGGGYCTQYVSGLASIHNAQNKNEDATTNYPYMGAYYEFYELMLAMMYTECGTLNTTDLYSMGVGCTQQETTSDTTWNNEQIAANSGIKMFASDGTVAGFAGLMSQSMKNGESGSAYYNLAALVGNSYYCFTKLGEALSVLDGITKAGLQAKVGSSASVFYLDDNGDMACSADGSIDLTTGEGMTANKRYYIVRDVPGCEGISDGVMTAVVNCYVKMNCADGVYTGTTDLTGGYVIYKFSHSCYRGLCIPMDGVFMQLSGAHYLTGRTADGYYNKFYCAEKWQDVSPLTNDTGYGDIGTEFNILKGLSLVTTVPGSSGWVGQADYSKSLFCFTAISGGSHTKEVCYTWNNDYMWGYSNGKPEVGKEGVKALVVGCNAINGLASARSADCNCAVSYGGVSYAGAFAVPQLKLS